MNREQYQVVLFLRITYHALRIAFHISSDAIAESSSFKDAC